MKKIITIFWLLSYWLIAQNMAAQPCTIDLANFTIPIAGDTLCADEPLELPAISFEAAADAANPGLIWVIYFGQPTNTNPFNDPNSGNQTLLVNTNGQAIINSGMADFSQSGVLNDTDPFVTVTIVPIIDDNIGDLQPVTMCTGIDVNYSYPTITFANPALNPNRCSDECTGLVPSNDSCLNATILDLNNFEAINGVTFTNICASATEENTTPNNCFFDEDAFQATVWFSFEGNGGTYTIVTSNTCTNLVNAPLGDTQLAIYEGDICGNDLATPLICNDDLEGGLAGVEDFVTEVGKTYYLVIDGFEETKGDFCFNIQEMIPPPPVDTCEATFGIVTLSDTPVCQGSTIQVSADGAAGDSLTTVFLITSDTATLAIDMISEDGILTLPAGNYQVHAFNYLLADSFFVQAALDNGATVLDLLTFITNDAFCGAVDTAGVPFTVLSLEHPDCFVCTADFGTVVTPDPSNVYCVNTSFTFGVENAASTEDGYTSVFILKNDSLNIDTVLTDGLVSGFASGEYLIHAYNYYAADSANCFAFDSVGVSFTILEETTPQCFVCAAATGTIETTTTTDTFCFNESFSFTLSGNATDGYTTLLVIKNEAGEFIDTIGVTDEVILSIAGNYTIHTWNFYNNDPTCVAFDSTGLSVQILSADAPECFVCAASFGTVVLPDTTTVCPSTTLTFSTIGANIEEYITAFLVTSDANATIDTINYTGTFDLASGIYTIHAINFYEEDSTTLINTIVEGTTINDLQALITSEMICASIEESGTIVSVLAENNIACLSPITFENLSITFVTDSNYTVSFDILGGDGNYFINEMPIVGNSFTSQPISCLENYVFEITDGVNSDTITISGQQACPVNCASTVGTMPNLDAPALVCAGSTITLNSNNIDVADEDVLIYMLHTSDTDTLGDIVAMNNIEGTFSLSTNENIAVNTIYYVSAVVGPKDATGNLILNDPCTQVAAGAPIVFLTPIAIIDTSFACSENEEEFYVASYRIVGGLPAFNPTATYTITGTFNGTAVANELQDSPDIPVAEPFNIIVTDGANCTVTLDKGDLGLPCITTPIELLDFQGTVLFEGNELKWATASEVNSDYFIIERSIDGTSFERVAEVNASGNSNTVKNYSFTDKDIEAGIRYYRLVEIDIDGKSTKFSPISLTRKAERSFGFTKLYPVPAYDHLQVNFNTPAIETVKLDIFSLAGTLVESKQILTKKGRNNLKLNVSNYFPGIYFISMTNGEQVFTNKFVKD